MIIQWWALSNTFIYVMDTMSGYLIIGEFDIDRDVRQRRTP